MRRASFAGLLFAFSLAAPAADPVAFVADLKGNATIEGDGKVSFLAELPAGTKLLLGTGASVAVTYAASGAEFTIVGPGEFLISSNEVRAEKGAAPTKRKVTSLNDPGVVSRVSQTAAASLRMRGLAAPGAEAALVYPVNTRVASLQPQLRWRGEAPADGFHVSVLDANGKEVWKSSSKVPSARPGAALAPSASYTWTVMAANGRIGEAQFQTPSAEAAARIEKSRSGAKSFSDRVMHAFLLQDAGASQDAKEAWGALARERPDLPELSVLAR